MFVPVCFLSSQAKTAVVLVSVLETFLL